MRATIMHAPGDVRVEDRDPPCSTPPTRSSRSSPPASAGRTCGRTAVRTSPPSRGRWATSTSASSRRSARDVTHHQARPVRRRLVLRLRQHLRDLPGRVPDPVRAPRSAWARRRAGRVRCASRWPTAPWSPRPACRPTTWSRPCSRPPTCWAPAGSRAVAADGRPGQDRRRRRRRRGRPARRAGRPAAGRRADHRDEPARGPPEAGPRVRRHRHRHRARRRRAWRGSRNSPTGSARTRVIEAVGTQESMMQAIRSTRPAGTSATSASPTTSTCPAMELFFSAGPPARRARAGAPVPARADRPHLDRRRSTPARSSTSTLPLDQAAEGYRAMDERRAIKVLLRP